MAAFTLGEHGIGILVRVEFDELHPARLLAGDVALHRGDIGSEQLSHELIGLLTG